MGAILCDRYVRQERPPSPVPTCVSMKSDRSKDDANNFQNEDGTNASRQVRETDSCQGYARKGMLGSQQIVNLKCHNQIFGQETKKLVDNSKWLIGVLMGAFINAKDVKYIICNDIRLKTPKDQLTK